LSSSNKETFQSVDTEGCTARVGWYLIGLDDYASLNWSRLHFNAVSECKYASINKAYPQNLEAYPGIDGIRDNNLSEHLKSPKKKIFSMVKVW